MRVRALKPCDAIVGPVTTALFEGQCYDLPQREALILIDNGCVERVETKQVEGPPEDKARRPRRNKTK